MIEEAGTAGRIAVVGAGTMGRGIAQVAALAGFEVVLTDAREGAADEAVAFVTGMLARAAEKGRLPPADAAAAAARLEPGTTAAGAELVIEAVVEDLAVKRRLFAELEGVVGAETVLATNTSSLPVTEIAAGLAAPERVVGLHFFNPVPVLRLVEIVPGERTTPGTVVRARRFVERLGHRGVVVRDTPGFVVNHVGRAYSTEALRLLDEGVADHVAIDRVLREAAGFRLGPFELLDLTGLDVSQPVMESVWSGFYGDPRLRPSPTGRRRLAAGRLGRKSGSGFYEYPRDEAPAQDEPPPYDGSPVWVSRAEGAGEHLAELLRGAGVRVEGDGRPSGDAVAVVTPWGEDVTTATLAQELAPERAVGVDPLGAYAGRLTLAGSPATTAATLARARAALGATGRAVTTIADSPGFVTQRVVAAIVNLACEVAQLRLAAPDDIDTAVRLGLAYPHGPLSWGDEIGPDRVLRVLDGLQRATVDPRYRPSLWLSRRARLGISLLAPDLPY